jgi:hypothetical protein
VLIGVNFFSGAESLAIALTCVRWFAWSNISLKRRLMILQTEIGELNESV